MEYRTLGKDGLKVSLIGLGTMTFGEQNSEAEAHQQLDYAIAHGVNLIDTAELYPVPPKPETYGRTETIIGTWLRKRGQRDDVVLATKVVGPPRRLNQSLHVRSGFPQLDETNLTAALHDSLKRLQTDYVDLYQLHWSDRSTNHFGQLGYEHVEEEDAVPIEETLRVLDGFVRAGKVRYIGLSNETPWGIARFLRAAEVAGMARIVSIQNPYNLLNRTFEIGCAEFAMRDHVGLLAYSPMAFGILSGKYIAGNRPEGARLTRWQRFARYNAGNAARATYEYVELFRKHGLNPAQAALAFVNQRRFVTSTLIGATNLEQLQTNIASLDIELNDEVLAGIAEIHQRYPNPAP